MNEKFPKSMLDALASQVPPADHPSADALTAYMEHGLKEVERSSVADHLARCAECREIVFLASGAGEEVQELALVAAASQAVSPQPRARWMPRLLWVGSLAAGLIVTGFFVREHYAKPSPATLVASNRASPSQPQRVAPQAEVTQQPPATHTAEPLSKAKPTQSISSKKAIAGSAIALAPVNSNRADDSQFKVAAAPASAGALVPQSEAPKAAPATIEIGNAVGGVVSATPHVNSFAPRPSQGNQSDEAGRTLELAVSTARVSTWRVNPQGQLEHMTESGWTRALADHPTVFRVVSSVRQQVWVGGDGGALFHSEDNGQHWTKATLPGPDGHENAAISKIVVMDAQHVTVINAVGTTYTTNDGGETWTKQ